MTPADEIRAAAFQLRNPFHLSGLKVPIDPDLAMPLADWLDIAAEYADKWPPDAQTNSPFRAGALDVARVINGHA
ncbi:hypothetical protein ACWENS_10550 [Streptomyces sp. NPDC004532]